MNLTDPDGLDAAAVSWWEAIIAAGEGGSSIGAGGIAFIVGGILHVTATQAGEGSDIIPDDDGGSCGQDSSPDNDGGSYGQDRLPTGSKPIDKTPWSGDHGKIKKDIGNGPDDDTWISPDDHVWSQNPDGTYTDHGHAGDYTGSGKPSGRKGKDRKKPRRR